MKQHPEIYRGLPHLSVIRAKGGIPAGDWFNFSWTLARSEHFATPHGRWASSFDSPYGQEDPIITETIWNALPWNPAVFVRIGEDGTLTVIRPTQHDTNPSAAAETEPDPNADPKPTWAWLMEGARLAEFDNFRYGTDGQAKDTRHLRREIAGGALSVGNDTLHLDEGTTHLEGLGYLADESAEAGRRLPPIVLRTADHRPLALWTKDTLRDFVSAAHRRKNIVETVHNRLIGKYYEIAAKRDDETRPIAEREKLAKEAQTFMDGYKDALRSGVASFSNDALPDKVDDLKGKLIDLIGDAANDARNIVLDVASGPDAFLDGSCVEEKRALDDIAVIRRGGLRNVREATTKEALQAEYTKVVRLLNAVPVTNAPLWLDTDGDPLVPDLDGFFDVTINRPEGGGRATATFSCLTQNHPPEDLKDDRLPKDLGSPYVYADRGLRGWSILTGRADKENNQRRTVQFSWGRTTAPKAGDTALFLSRNNCGVSKLRIRLIEPPAEPAPE